MLRALGIGIETALLVRGAAHDKSSRRNDDHVRAIGAVAEDPLADHHGLMMQGRTGRDLAPRRPTRNSHYPC